VGSVIHEDEVGVNMIIIRNESKHNYPKDGIEVLSVA